MGGGGSSNKAQTVNQTSTTSNLPEYARPYFEDLLNRTQSVSQEGYISYPGQRVAGFNGDQQQSFNMTRDLANNGAPDIDTARNTLAGSLGAIGSTAGYQARDINSPLFNTAIADYYSSPYMDQVVDRQKAGAIRDFNEGRASRSDPAINQGAFGGYRDMVQRGVAERGLEARLGDIEATGRQSAFENAQQQFERDRTSNFNTQVANEQNRAGAAGVRQSAGALGLQGAQTAGGLASTDQTLELQRIQALQGVGSLQQQLQQAGMDTAYNDFVNQRDFPRQQLNFYSSILRGTPISANSEVTTATTPNPMNQALGLGLGGLGLYRAMA